MTFKLVVFSSLNQVALVKRALQREKVYATMLRTPSCLTHTGCSYALRCREEDIAKLEKVCSQWKIEPGGIFADVEDTAPRLDNELLDQW
jgi:hypothetical protein